MTISHNIYLLLTALVLSLAAGSCSSNDTPDNPAGDYGNEVDVTFTLATTGSNAARAFRPEAPEAANELINNWTVVFTTTDNTVVKIVSGGALNNPVKTDNLRTQLHTGRYNIYAFANFSTLQATFGVNPVEGSSFDPHNNLFYQNFSIKQTELIPLTRCLTNVYISGKVTEPFKIELIRSLAKVEFSFANQSMSPVTIKAIDFEAVYPGNISIFKDPASDTSTPSYADYSTVTTSNISVATMQPGTDFTDGAFSHIYIPEGNPSLYPGKAYTVRVRMQRPGADSDDEIVAFVSTDKAIGGIDAIRRNDYVQIPITISDWIIDFDVLFYPPIGGYPAVEKVEQNKQLFFTFLSPGKFVIIPKVRNAAPGSPFLLPSQYTLTLSFSNIPAGLFTTQPATDATSGEIIGELGNTKGYTVINANLSINGVTSLVYSRNLVIIRQ